VEQIDAAIAVNAVFPSRLARAAAARGIRVLQIATDCVYSGAKGMYLESDPHDALDVYGKTKSLGETFLPAAHHLRCSIIGPEPRTRKFLIEWFRRQPIKAEVSGFTNHRWNGVTTLHFAKLCAAIIGHDLTLGHAQHVVPSGTITKAKMLREFAHAYDRPDIVIRDTEAKTLVDRTLGTNQAAENAALWAAAGYSTPPTVEQMIAELSRFPYRGDRPRPA
jgi:dTDP-4-dehydrorhamnose reductase